jgi:RNA recognition motif-containing protein
MVREDRDAERKETATTSSSSYNSNSRSGGDAAAAASAKGSSVFVGNLSFDTSWQDLKDLCRQHGKVDRVEVMEKDGRKKGYGIVTFATSQDAAHAIRKLDGRDFQGRQLDVKMERKRDDQASAAMAVDSSSSSTGACQLYVGNLSYECSWQDLKDLCRKHGLPVDRAEVIEKDGRKKGFGIVTVGNARDAEMAIRKLKGVEFQGRTLEVRLDHKSGYTPNPSSAAMATSSGGGAQDEDCRLFVGNLSFECSWQDLKDHFKKCGRVEHAEVIEGADGRKRGFGIVTFANPSETAMAMERLDDVEFQGRRLEVRLDRKSDRKSEPSFKAGPPKESYRKKEAGFKAGPRKEAPVKKNKVEKEPEPYDHQGALGSALKSSR